MSTQRKKFILIINSLIMLFLLVLISGFIGGKISPNKANAGEKLEWKSNKADPDLVKVVNFLMNNKGKEIDLAGEKHKITGKEEVDIVVKVPGCCEVFFKKGIDVASTYGKVIDSNFKEASVHALIPAEKIPEMAASSFILGVNFKSEAKDYWIQVLK